MNLTQVLITGAFGIVIAIVTWFLAGFRESNTYKRELKKERINKLENLYAQTISQLEQMIRITKSGESNSAIDKQVSDNNALLSLLSTSKVNMKLEEVSHLLYSWSSNYRQGAPKRKNNSEVVIISNQDLKYRKTAEEQFPLLNNEIISLINIMKEHLGNEGKA